MTERIANPRMSTLLVVEKDQELKDAIQGILMEAGYKVVTAENGSEGLQQFEKSNPALILSCIRMPFMDGFILLEAIRRRPEGKLTPFIFLADTSDQDDYYFGMAQGAEDYLVKPIQRDELLAVVDAHLRGFEEQLKG